MAKKKNVPDSAVAESSRNAEWKTVKNMKTLHAKLLKEEEDHQKEIEQLRQQIVLPTEQLELIAAEINEVKMRLLTAVEEKHVLQIEPSHILQQRDLSCPQKSQDAILWWKNKK